jgi:type I restriction enzyme M protein
MFSGGDMTYLERAIKDGHAKVTGEGKQHKITYIAVGQTERFSDPEEQVRAEFWAELIYRYGYEPISIGVEIVVPDRTPSDRADLVVFHDDTRKRPYAIIECKKDGITDAEFNQAVEQTCGNGTWAKFRADYVMVVAGTTRRAFDFTGKYGSLERETNIIADLPIRYGKPEEYKYHKGGSLDIQTVNKETLIRAIQKCHQTLWGGGRLSPPTAFGELCKIIFVKISDEQAKRKKGEPYEFQIKTHETSRRLGERIRALYETQKEKDPEVFTETIKIDDATLRTVVSHLESINLSKTDLDTKGLAFEQFMDGFFKGDFGQYFTPREIIEFTVQMMKPTNEDLVLDPACGSGGFLLHALDAVRKEAGDYYDEGTAEHYKHWHDFAKERLFGIEINEEIARVAKMNMIIHDDGHTNVVGRDALDAIKRMTSQNKGIAENRFDLILTNPPFGAMVKQEEKPYLSTYEMSEITSSVKMSAKVDPKMGKKMVKKKTSVKTEILFCEQVWRFLKPGTGRAAIILPDGILTNSSLQGVRDWLLNKFQLLAVVSLPQSAFAHFGAGVKASIIFIRKRAENEVPRDNEAIFMAIAENIGYDATGRKTMKVIDTQIMGKSKTEIQRCDLYDVRVTFENVGNEEAPQWVERHALTLKNTGILGQYSNFLKDPAPFFV